MNRDSKPDVIVLNEKSETVGILSNNGFNSCPVPPAFVPNKIIVPLFGKAVVSNGRRLVYLDWGTDVRSENVVLFRNGVKRLTTPNDSYHWDDATSKKGASFRYKVCENGSFQSCSSEVNVQF
ncbi:hypothetical protein L0156_02145 [bacterium]|nr:hypothetical protein [bacterium]